MFENLIKEKQGNLFCYKAKAADVVTIMEVVNFINKLLTTLRTSDYPYRIENLAETDIMGIKLKFV